MIFTICVICTSMIMLTIRMGTPSGDEAKMIMIISTLIIMIILLLVILIIIIMCKTYIIT